LLQPANAHVSLKGLTRQLQAMTPVDKNREHTLVEEPWRNNFDEKLYTRDSKTSRIAFTPLMIDSSVLSQPPTLRYKLVIQPRYGPKMNWTYLVRPQSLFSFENVLSKGSRLRICCMQKSY
jgi:hypothetical protein